MTNAAQSALLKVIEEPPKTIYFFLCTTEPSKLLPAIRSRCTPLEVKLLTLNHTISMLTWLTSNYPNKLPVEILEAIHVMSGGHARDAIKQCEVALTTGCVTLA